MNIKLWIIITIGALLPMIEAVSANTATTPSQSTQTDQTEYFYYSSVEGKVPLNLTVDKLGLRFRKEVLETDRQDFFNTYSEIAPVQPEVSLKDIDCILVQVNDSTDKDCLKSVMDELAIQPEIEFVFPVFHKGVNGKDFMLTDRVSVVADNSFNKNDMEALFTSYGLFIQDIHKYKRIGKTAFRLVSSEQPSVKILQAANSIDKYAKGIHAAPVFMSLFPTIALIPNDPLYNDIYGNGWHLFNTRINPPRGPDHINAEAGWDIETGNLNIIVAILDTGIDFDHVDLDDHIWTNNDEIPGNNTDDDGNGFIDDVHGWDFINDDNEPIDDNGHGTMMSGIVSANTNNEVGIAGTAWYCTLMPVKEHDAGGSNTPYQNADGIMYALENDAHIINISAAWETDVPEEQAAISETRVAGSLILAATGNSDDGNILYPAGYPGVMAVGGSNFCGERWRSRLNWCNNFTLGGGSNFGPHVDIIAPANDISTTSIGSQYTLATGTSVSTPQVAGLAALLLSVNLNEAEHPTLSPVQVQAYMQLSAYDCIYSDWFESAIQGRDEYTGYGRIDVYQALVMRQEPKLSLKENNGPALFSIDKNGIMIVDGVVKENTSPISMWYARTYADTQGYKYIYALDFSHAGLMYMETFAGISDVGLSGRHLWLRGKLYRMTSLVTPPDGSLIIRNGAGNGIGFLNSFNYYNAVPYIDLQGNSIPINSTISPGSLVIYNRVFLGGDPDRLSSQGYGL